MRVNAFVSMIVAAGLAAASSILIAQNAPSPAPSPPPSRSQSPSQSPAPPREMPRPQDIDPTVDTSATPPVLETPPMQDVEPRVNTSPAEATPGASAAPNAGKQSPSAAAAKPGAKGKALDRLELDTTQITGNRELPKVLYIVPWKRSDLGDLVGRPVNSLLDEVLTPVDRDVFQRENRYYRALTPGAVENDALSAPDARPATPTRSPVPTNSAPAAGMPGSATHPTNASAGGASTGSGSAASPPRDEK